MVYMSNNNLYLQKKTNKQMKISKILLVLFVAVSILSCKKDDGPAAFEFNSTNIIGSYSLDYYRSSEVETVDFNGVDVVSSTIETGDTFDVDVVFASNGTSTADGVFRVTYDITVAGQNVPQDPEIVVINNEVSPYSVSAGALLLTIDGDTYQVSLFNETEMHISLEEITTQPNGDNVVYNEEIRFTRL